MTFRDDHDAALARADALEVDLKRAEAERDELKQALAKQAAEATGKSKSKSKSKNKNKKPKPQPSSDDDAPQRRYTFGRGELSGKNTAIIMAVVIAVLAAILVPAYLKGQRRTAKRAAWHAAHKAIEHHITHWQQLISVEPCVRDVALDTVGPVSHRRPEVFDPRRDSDNFGYDLGSVAENCGYPVREIAKDPSWPATVREPLRAWMDIETELTHAVEPLRAYLSNADWKEDDYRGGRQMWATLLAVIAKRDAALTTVRTQALPVLRAEIKRLGDAHLAQLGGHGDEIWWRIELGLAQWEIDEIALDASGVYAGHDFDVAAAAPRLQKPVAALLARAPAAPIEIRRQLRTIEWVTTPLAAGQVPQGETPLWHMVDGEADLIAPLHDREKVPALPPDPGPKPVNNDDD